MTTTVPINGLSLQVNSPIDSDRLDRIIAVLAAAGPATVADIGCGWVEVLLRVLDAAPNATGVGIDLEQVDIDRGRQLAAERGLTDRVDLQVGDAAGHRGSYDLVLCAGAHHVYAEDAGTGLRALRKITADGGRLLFAIDYWLDTPSPERLDAIWGGATLDDSRFLADVVDAAAAAGWRMLDLYEVTQQEWDAYECGLVRNQEEWLLANPGHPEAGRLRERLDQERASWLRGHHGQLGYAWLTLGALPG